MLGLHGFFYFLRCFSYSLTHGVLAGCLDRDCYICFWTEMSHRYYGMYTFLLHQELPVPHTKDAALLGPSEIPRNLSGYRLWPKLCSFSSAAVIMHLLFPCYADTCLTQRTINLFYGCAFSLLLLSCFACKCKY